ncbi:MAG TPA: DUF3089 domain-containing protein [Candidatus Wallbacteria bacterium]|nr:DUF3089 domain-containing protein [Candidatus Wallbacteria bacterium]
MVRTFTDYSNPERWLALPSSLDKKTDVFYIYPSSFRKIDKTEPDICEIDNPVMIKIAGATFNLQAAAFETAGNIFAPYYRQVDAVFCASLPVEEQNKYFAGIPKSDIFAAFDYYVKHLNGGRPFILAGHSLGSIMLKYLLAEYIKENPHVYSRMIAAYVIGYSVTEKYLSENPHLKFAEGPDDTKVIISYNTEAPEIEGVNGVLLPGAISINPITWTRDETLAEASENLGSIVTDENGKILTVKNYADARVDKTRGVVICGTVDVEKVAPGNIIFGKGIYHGYDYQFYFHNIRENAARRVKNFLSERIFSSAAAE